MSVRNSAADLSEKGVRINFGEVGGHLGERDVVVIDDACGQQGFKRRPVVRLGERDDVLGLGDDGLPSVDARLGDACAFGYRRLLGPAGHLLHVLPPAHERSLCVHAWRDQVSGLLASKESWFYRLSDMRQRYTVIRERIVAVPEGAA